MRWCENGCTAIDDAVWGELVRERLPNGRDLVYMGKIRLNWFRRQDSTAELSQALFGLPIVANQPFTLLSAFQSKGRVPQV